MRSFFKYTGIAIVIVFALIGFVFTAVFVGMRFGIFNVRGSIAERNSFFPQSSAATPCTENTYPCAWNETPEWETVAGGLLKDASVIHYVSAQTGVPARVIAAVVVPEQLRFFTSEREIFKSYFEPLKILGSLSQFSLGISGIKQDTAVEIEQYAHNPHSPFYPGDGMANLIAYSPNDTNLPDALYNRLTDPKNHYYSYLYTALAIKELEAQWHTAGYDIGTQPGIVATLFNIGFGNSKPNPAPLIGGAEIDIGGSAYSFGDLANDFYSSQELIGILPRSLY